MTNKVDQLIEGLKRAHRMSASDPERETLYGRAADALEESEKSVGNLSDANAELIIQIGAAEAERDALAATLKRLRLWANTYSHRWVPGVRPETFDQGVGASAHDVLTILDSAPPVARPLPDREALARVIDPAIYEDISHLTGSAWDAALRAADAVLAAIEKGGESNGN